MIMIMIISRLWRFGSCNQPTSSSCRSCRRRLSLRRKRVQAELVRLSSCLSSRVRVFGAYVLPSFILCVFYAD